MHNLYCGFKDVALSNISNCVELFNRFRMKYFFNSITFIYQQEIFVVN